MRVTLVRPPFQSLMGISNASHPLGLGYLSAALSESGVAVSVVDGEMMSFQEQSGFTTAMHNLKSYMLPYADGKKMDRLEAVISDQTTDCWTGITDAIVGTAPDVIGITCFTVSMTVVKMMTARLKQALPDAKIVLGGVHPTSMPDRTLRDIPSADLVVTGEGEEVIVQLVRELGRDAPDLRSVAGIAYRDAAGALVQNPRGPLIANLDAIPLPTRSWPGLSYSSHLAFTSRGCPFTCAFCDSRSIWTRKVRYTSIDRIMEELDHLSGMAVPFLRFSDDTFTVNRRRISQWMQLARDGGYHKKMKFGFGTRVELIDRDVVEEYADSGVIDINFGIETGSASIRRAISKDFKDTDPFEAVKIVNDAGIGTRTFFMIGHPGERPEDVEQTISLIKRLLRLPRNYVQIHITCPYPGTELWQLAQEKTGGKDFVDIDTYYRMFHQNSPIVNLTEMSDAEIEQHLRVLYRLATLSIVRSRLNVWGRQAVSQPLSTLTFIKDRIMSKGIATQPD